MSAAEFDRDLPSPCCLSHSDTPEQLHEAGAGEWKEERSVKLSYGLTANQTCLTL